MLPPLPVVLPPLPTEVPPEPAEVGMPPLPVLGGLLSEEVVHPAHHPAEHANPKNDPIRTSRRVANMGPPVSVSRG
jgi:hypothetical protein